MGKVIAISNQKGGVGKTTTSVNLTAALGAFGKKVLILDSDPQGNTSSGYGINKKQIENSIYHVMVDQTPIENAIIKTPFRGVDIIPSGIDLAGAEMELVEKENRTSTLKSGIAKIKSNYDYIFIDCPPSLGLITLNALTACDTVLIPIQCEYYAMEGLAQLMDTIRKVKRMYNSYLEIEGVLLTMFDSRLNLTAQVVAEIKKHFRGKVFSTFIPRNVKLSEAPSFGKPVIYYDVASRGTQAYKSLAEEFLKNNRSGQ